MSIRLYYCFLFIFLCGNCKAQNLVVPQTENYSSKDDYKDFITVKTQIWALTISGKLKIFDLTRGTLIAGGPKIDSPIVAVAKDRQSNIALAYGGKIMVFNKKSKTLLILGQYDGQLYGIVFNTFNQCFLITDRGIEDLLTHKIYFSDSSMNKQIHYRGHSFRRPSSYCIDGDNNIWIGFSYGEWGGNILIFNTTNDSFVLPKLGEFQLELNPVKCIFLADSLVFLSSGLQHMLVSGSIIRFDHLSATFLFASEENPEKGIHGEYIGPAAFNPTDHCIYFYSQDGIFEGNPENDLSTIDKWRKVISPKLNWSYGQPDAVGYSMNVLKMEFADNNLIFLTQSDGIGIYNKKRIILIR